jgi:hypothetical protein
VNIAHVQLNSGSLSMYSPSFPMNTAHAPRSIILEAHTDSWTVSNPIISGTGDRNSRSLFQGRGLFDGTRDRVLFDSDVILGATAALASGNHGRFEAVAGARISYHGHTVHVSTASNNQGLSAGSGRIDTAWDIEGSFWRIQQSMSALPAGVTYDIRMTTSEGTRLLDADVSEGYFDRRYPAQSSDTGRIEIRRATRNTVPGKIDWLQHKVCVSLVS